MSESSSIPKDDDVVDGPRRFAFVLDDSLTNAAVEHENPTDYLRRPKAKPEKEPRPKR